MTSRFDLTVIIKTKKRKNGKLNSVEIAIAWCGVHNVNNDKLVASEYIFCAITHSSDKIWASWSATFMLLVLSLVLFYPFPTLKIWMWWSCGDFVKSYFDVYSSVSTASIPLCHSPMYYGSTQMLDFSETPTVSSLILQNISL